MKVSEIKNKVAAKVAKGKEKVAKKCGNACKKSCVLAFILLGVCGCQNPAQRAQTADVTVYNYGTANFGSEFVSLAQSNETGGNDAGQTASPSTDLKFDFDARYNDAIAGASTASMGILESLTYAGANKVLSLMQSKASGTVTVENKNGGTTTVKCENGQCYPCEDGTCNP